MKKLFIEELDELIDKYDEIGHEDEADLAIKNYICRCLETFTQTIYEYTQATLNGSILIKNTLMGGN